MGQDALAHARPGEDRGRAGKVSSVFFFLYILSFLTERSYGGFFSAKIILTEVDVYTRRRY